MLNIIYLCGCIAWDCEFLFVRFLLLFVFVRFCHYLSW